MALGVARSGRLLTQRRSFAAFPRRVHPVPTNAPQLRRPEHNISIAKSVAPSRTKLIYAIAGTTLVGLSIRALVQSRNEVDDDPRDMEALSAVSFGKLCSGWVAFAFCSVPVWVDMSEPLYRFISRIPVISTISDFFVMRTFFNQFLGGQTTEDCITGIEDLHKRQIGTLLGYNIEAELDGSSKDPTLIMAQTESGSRFWVRIKVTGLLPHPVALYRGSKAILKARADKGLDEDVPLPGLPHDGDWEAALTGEGVTQADREQLLGLRATLETIASKARANNVRIVVDAEQSWYQPVIDSLTDELMQEYNTLDGPATCIASFQAYLRRHPALIDQQIHRAKEKGYKLLFKQVRGAYMVTEASQHKEEKQGQAPIWSTKEETDASFNYGIEKALETVASQTRDNRKAENSVVFATHNANSVELVISLLEKHGLAKRRPHDGKLFVRKEVAESFAFAQLYGMKDDLTNKITGSIIAESGVPLVVKSMSYGELKECLPFLARRATENKAILEGRGGAAAERLRLGREIRRRILPFTA